MSTQTHSSPVVVRPFHHRNIPSVTTFHSQEIPPQEKQQNGAEAKHHHIETGVKNETVDTFERTQVGGEEVVAGINLKEEFKVVEGGWHGYVEWEKEEEREKGEKAKKVLLTKKFTPIPEFQYGPLPTRNPILFGERWKEYHLSLGPAPREVPAESWAIVQEEKAKDMLHVLEFPYNGSPSFTALMKNHITPNKDHFVRNHGGVPTYDDPLSETSPYTFEVGGLVGKAGSLTLAELMDETKFPQKEMTITLQCCGTRRTEQIEYAPGEGDELLSAPWGEGAIGTAVYKGVALRHVLEHFGGVKNETSHVEFIGADTYFKKNTVYNYAVSVPYRKVMSNFDEVILAYQMNGVPLPKIHGGPLRVVVAGYIGARSTKWLTRINVLDEPSNGPVQRQEYLYFNHQFGKHNVTYSHGFSIQDMPVASAILFPAPKSVQVHDGFIDVAGWAYSGGGRWIERVEVSTDGGFNWFEVPEKNLSPKFYHAKRLWHMSVPVIAEGWLELCVRAWDNACNTQPTNPRDAWNWTLHVTSTVHRMKVYSVNRNNAATRERLEKLEAAGDGIEPLTRPAKILVEPLDEYKKAMEEKGIREPRE
ncbi:Oxidoreductase, molybdopterin-binding domain-containing protein [Mrakia frigida]|uniref:sulfite oxidase n=1 Tax=Mrakia frigida TaxID=29902 RepID=UPI003FCC1EC7